MVYLAACGYGFIMHQDTDVHAPHWFELAKTHWAQVYRTTGTPCSCWLCTYGKKYNRIVAKRETLRILREEDGLI